MRRDASGGGHQQPMNSETAVLFKAAPGGTRVTNINGGAE